MSADPTFDPVSAGRAVLHSARMASLATLTSEGHPFASLVSFATMPDLAPILWLSDLAVHSRNLARDARASLLVVAPGGEGGDPLAGARITLTGTIVRTEDPAAGRRFGWVHGSGGRPDFADFHAYRMEITSAYLVAGFGRIVTITAGDLLIDLADAEGLLSGEAMVVDHMNEDHGDAINLYATVLLGLPAADWRLSGCDPDGVDLVAAGTRARMPFPSRAATVAEAGGHLKHWARLARERMGSTKI